MMKRPTRMLTMILVFAIIASYICMPVQAYDKLSLSDQEVIASSKKAINVYNSRTFVSYEELMAKKWIIGDGLTIIYGNNIELDVAKVFGTSENLSNVNEYQNKDENISTNKPVLTNTYVVIVLKQGKRIDFEYISVTYDVGISTNLVNGFIETEVSVKNLESKVSSFLRKQVDNETSALYYAPDKRSTASATVVQTIADTNYYITNYNTWTGGSYPVIVYKKDITYTALAINYQYEDGDKYFIIADVTFTPGNAYDLLENEINNYDTLGVYNDVYDDAISIRAIRSIFENINPNSDRIIQISPSSNMNDINGKRIYISLGTDAVLSNSFVINSTSLSTLYMSSVHNEFGQSMVMFEGRRVTGPDCLCFERIGYRVGVYMSCATNVLSTRVATDISYFFQYPGESSANWVGSAREFYYVN